jgi:hypothetical protein
MTKTTKQKADELIESMDILDNPFCGVYNMTHYQKLRCAIICQEREVKNNEKTYKCLIKYGVHSDAYRRLTSKFNEAQELLTELKSRL